MLKQKTSAYAPASVANVACGYDTLGFAVEGIGDIISVSLNGTMETKITEIKGDGNKLPLDIHKNTCGVSILSYLNHYNIKEGLDISIQKKLPLCSGLGSSSSSAVAGAVAANDIFNKTKEKRDLLPFVIEGEKIASNSAHADNVAPSLLGGLCFVRDCSKFDIFKLPTMEDIYVVLVTPKIEINTKESRKLIPQSISLADAQKQWSNLGSFIHALHTKDYNLMQRSLKDYIAEPYRKCTIPHYEEYKRNMEQIGTLTCNISGSGPTIFNLTTSKQTAKKIIDNSYTFFNAKNVIIKTYLTTIDDVGAKIMKQ